MPHIETPEELAEVIADWLGVYGCCKSDGDEGCEFNRDRPFCCRTGFVGELQERIEKSVENQNLLNKAANEPGEK